MDRKNIANVGDIVIYNGNFGNATRLFIQTKLRECFIPGNEYIVRNVIGYANGRYFDISENISFSQSYIYYKFEGFVYRYPYKSFETVMDRDFIMMKYNLR